MCVCWNHRLVLSIIILTIYTACLIKNRRVPASPGRSHCESGRFSKSGRTQGSSRAVVWFDLTKNEGLKQGYHKNNINQTCLVSPNNQRCKIAIHWKGIDHIFLDYRQTFIIFRNIFVVVFRLCSYLRCLWAKGSSAVQERKLRKSALHGKLASPCVLTNSANSLTKSSSLQRFCLLSILTECRSPRWSQPIWEVASPPSFASRYFLGGGGKNLFSFVFPQKWGM